MTIRVTLPTLPTAAELAVAIDAIARSGQGSNHGPFERMLCQIARTLFGMSVATAANATLGLELALRRLVASHEREVAVLVPSFTFPATAQAIVNAGATPVFCDVDDETWIMPRVGASRWLAVVPVCSLGVPLPAEWRAERRGRIVVDAAAALDNHLPEPMHFATVYSLHATKPIAAGEGALVAVRFPEQEEIRTMANFGLRMNEAAASVIGTNAKLSEYHAAVALVSWTSWPERRRRLREIHALYRETLGDAVGWQKTDRPSYAALGVRVPDAEGMARALAENGIETRRWYWPPLHKHPAFMRFPVLGSLEVTEALGRELIGLPFHARLSDVEVTQVCSAVRKVLGR